MTEQPLILVVDDEAAFREIFTLKLGGLGYRVETAENGAVGVEKAKQLKPDLILMDMDMPVMNGAAAVLKLREDPETENLKVVFFSGLSHPHTKESQALHARYSSELGAYGYISKTEDLGTIADKIKEFLQ